MRTDSYKRSYCRLQLEHLENRRVLATFFVDGTPDGPVTGDNGAMQGSLRQMLENANATLELDEIRFLPSAFPVDGLSQTLQLTEGELVVTREVSIIGPGSGELTIQAADTSAAIGDGSRHFRSSTAIDLSLSGLTMVGGDVDVGDSTYW